MRGVRDVRGTRQWLGLPEVAASQLGLQAEQTTVVRIQQRVVFGEPVDPRKCPRAIGVKRMEHVSKVRALLAIILFGLFLLGLADVVHVHVCM